MDRTGGARIIHHFDPSLVSTPHPSRAKPLALQGPGLVPPWGTPQKPMSQSTAKLPAPDATAPRATLRRVVGMILAFRRNLALVALLSTLAITCEILEVRTIGHGFIEIETLAAEAGRAVASPSLWEALTHPPIEFLRRVRSLALLILALAAVRSVFLFSNRVALARLGESVVWHLRTAVLAALQKLSFSYYDRNYSGQLINRATTDVQQIRRLIGMVWFPVLQAAIYGVGYSIMLFSIDPVLACVAMATIPACVLVLLDLARKLRPAFRETRGREDDMVTAIQENISGVEVVKAFAREQAERSKFHGVSEEVFGRVMVIVDLFRKGFPTFRGLVRLNLAAVLAVGGLQVMNGSLKIGELVIFTMAVTVIGHQLQFIVQVTNQLQEALASAERIFEILDARPEVAERPGARALPRGGGHVVFDRVGFAYEPDKPVLRDVYLEVAPGEVVALVGPTGAGKSTLVSLVTRFYDVTAGTVRIDGMDVRDATLQSLRGAIGLVFQETFLFSASVADNIAFGALDVTREQIVEAARIAQADAFIAELSNGYDTVIGERGVTLSGGQRQRLAIARAIVRNPRILILDRTVFIIAHRLSSLARADRVVVIEQGRITQTGTHAELMAVDGHYRQIARLQIAPEEDRALLAETSARGRGGAEDWDRLAERPGPPGPEHGV
jgi:ABC-type multidrug transport system fused ATPase/permease subunit